MLLDNHWNKVIYKVWAPIYDLVFNEAVFSAARQRVFRNVHIEPKQQILFIGVGTGADLPFIMDKDVEITGIDLSREMLQIAQGKYHSPHITFMEMDAQELTFPSESFDMVVANLILSVVPDPNRCIQEMIRVTCAGGQILIFDKFVPSDRELSVIKKCCAPS